MPEFEMPAGVPGPARPTADPAIAPSEPPPAHTAEPESSARAMGDGRRGINWRHVLVAGVVGVLAGAAIPGGIQVAERAAVSGDQSNLRDVAMEYLTAIAEGRASDATAMVGAPVPGQPLPDAVLQSARRITDPQVRLVHIDGDAATVEVEYTLGSPQIARSIEAERVGGTWQISHPLTEAVPFHHNGGTTGARIAGFEIAFGQALHLYPGIYSFDPMPENAIVASSSDPFSVDGNPATPTEPFIHMSLLPGAAERAEAVALALGERCMADASCRIPAEATLRVEEGMWVVAVTPQAVEVMAHLTTMSSNRRDGHQILMRIERDPAGDATAWLCSALDAHDLADPEPCPAID